MSADVLTIPKRCGNGHALEARTVFVFRERQILRWRCIPCARAAVFRAHHGDGATIPAAVLDPSRFSRQQSLPVGVSAELIVFEAGPAVGFEAHPQRTRPYRRRAAAAAAGEAA